jgi:hypothetical protein
MFGVDLYQPWTGVGDAYEQSRPRLLVLGETRFDARFTDREIIMGQLGGVPHLTFTNFNQAVLGLRRWAEGYDAATRAFWQRTLFANYNTTFFSGATRHLPPREARLDPQNARLLRDLLTTYKPSHAIVWGEENWATVAVADAAWRDEAPVATAAGEDPCRSVALDGARTLFLRVKHPAVGFAYERWAPPLAAFLALSI